VDCFVKRVEPGLGMGVAVVVAKNTATASRISCPTSPPNPADRNRSLVTNHQSLSC
jgi:hypothetical protein